MGRVLVQPEEGVALSAPEGQGSDLSSDDSVALPASECPGPRNPFFTSIDIAPIIFFRVTFGLLMLIDVFAYAVSGELRIKWIDPSFHFTYYGFGWIPTPPGNWMYVIVAVQMLAALGIMLGCAYRLSAIVFCLATTWTFLMDQTNYMNHHYLICLVAFLAIFMPANRCYSIDALRRPTLESTIAPAWTLWLLRAQMGIAYFYGGLAKINSDWLRGEPVRTWFSENADTRLLGDILNTEFIVRLVTYGGLLFDLFIVPLLLWRRTRLPAFLAAVFFHLSNAFIFDIGIFPFLSIALTALFFAPERLRQIIEFVRTKFFRGSTDRSSLAITPQIGFHWAAAVLLFLSVYLTCQLLVPFRHFFYPGNVSWTEEGHRFAWHMMLRRKSGDTAFMVIHRDSGYTWKIDPRGDLTPLQYRKMAGRPDMILQYAHHLRDRLNLQGYSNFAVHASSQVRLNDHPPALLINPEIDLTTVHRSLRPSEWILPLENKVPVPRKFRTANINPPQFALAEGGK